MLSLFEYLEKHHNSSLEFINPEQNVGLSWDELTSDFPDLKSSSKRLAFLYLDNSVAALKTLLAFLKSEHAVCLLSNSLNLELKQKLEKTYSPYYIADFERADLASAKVEWEIDGLKVFHVNNMDYPMHPELKILLSTSGSTGSPKFVKLTSQNFIANAESILDYLPINPSDSCMLNLPIHYSYGLSVLLTNIVNGGKIVCSNETVLSRNFWNVFEKYKCTSLAGVPYTYEMLARIGFAKNKYPSLKYMTQAGGKLNDTTLRQFADYSHTNNIRFYVMYGQTEATARMSYLKPEMLTKKLGSMGMPIKNGKFSIDNATHELIYSGPNVGCGYAEKIEDLKDCTYLKELRTGDVARVDGEGYYYITGRIKRFIKLFGNRISLDEVETELKNKYKCFIGCTGVEDKAMLVFSDNSSINADEIRNYISEKYQVHISVIKYIFTNSLPLTSNQKVDYKAIIEANGNR
jgi:acyl-CoA synthetase (AMP-forming)/AMP-acid ligase II